MQENLYRESVISLMNGDLTFDEKLANFALGLCGESAELFDLVSTGRMEKVEDESSDCRWYYTANLILLNESSGEVEADFTVPPMYYLNSFQLATELMLKAGRVGDLIKKVVFHKHPLERHKQDIVKELHNYFVSYIYFLTSVGLTDEQVKQYNYDKLNARYDGLKFTTEQSINRNNEIKVGGHPNC